MAYSRSLGLVLLLAIICYIGSAQQLELYFDAQATVPAPLIVDENSCTELLPCRFGDNSAAWHRYYSGTSIKAIFKAGTYTTTPEIHFGCSKELSILSQGHVGFIVNGNIYFGNSTHKVESFNILDSDIAFHNEITSIYAFAKSNAVIANSTILSHICSSCSIALDLGNKANVLIKDVEMKSSGTPDSAFQISSDTNLSSLSIRRTSFSDTYGSILKLRANRIETVDFLKVEVFVDFEAPLVSHIDGPANHISVDTLTMEGCDFNGLSSDMNSNFRIFPETAQIEETEFGNSAFSFQPPSTRGKKFSFSFNEVGRGSILVARYKEVFMRANIFDESISLEIQDIGDFESNYDQYRLVNSVNVSNADEAWFDSIHSRDSNFNLESIVSAAVTYSLIERQSGISDFAIEVSDHIILYESAWINWDESSNAPMLVFSSFGTPMSPVSVLGSALIMGLAVNTQDAEFQNFGELHIVDSLTGAHNQKWINSGVFAFYSHPDTCEPVALSNVAILPNPNPRDFSLISAVVWSHDSFCGAMKIGANVALAPNDHVLEVLIISGNANDPVDGSQPVPILHVHGPSPLFDASKNFTAVYPSIDFTYDPAYSFTGFISIATGPYPVYEYQVTNFTCPKNCSKTGQCVGVNTCACDSTYSGYSCDCHDLPESIICSNDEEDHWFTASDLQVDFSSNFEFPEETGANINGSLFNRGNLVLKNARYDINGALTNQGQLKIMSTISQVRNATVSTNSTSGCIFVPTSRSFAKNLVLAPGSTVTIDLDLASAATSVCPSDKPSTNPSFMLASKNSNYGPRIRSRSAEEMQELLISKRQSAGTKFIGSSQPKSSQAKSKAAKSKSLLESDSNSMNGSMMLVNITSVPVEPISITLVASRNASATTIPLLVEVKAPSGVCTTVENTPNLVTLIATPCFTSPETPSPSGTISKTRWYYIAAPIIAVSGAAVVAAIVILTVPQIRKAVFPYSG